jgi:hypothetical protein
MTAAWAGNIANRPVMLMLIASTAKRWIRDRRFIVGNCLSIFGSGIMMIMPLPDGKRAPMRC